jgi:hypothetical protein
MKELWGKKLGFKAHMLGDFYPFVIRSGDVHCIKKYISRGV